MNRDKMNILEDLVFLVYLSKIADFENDDYLKIDVKYRLGYKINEAIDKGILYKAISK